MRSKGKFWAGTSQWLGVNACKYFCKNEIWSILGQRKYVLRPLQLIVLINETVLAQTKYQYPFAMVYEQECYVYSVSRNTLIN